MDNKDKAIGHAMGHSGEGRKNAEEANYFSVISKRTEKLSSALYLITNLLSDTEPLKWELRSRGLDLLSDICTMGGHLPAERAILFSRTQGLVRELASLLEIGRTGALISDMNCSILCYEYGKLVEMLEEGARMKSPAEEFVSELFKEEHLLPMKTGDKSASYKGQGNVLYNPKGHDVLYGNRDMSFSNKTKNAGTSKVVKDTLYDRGAAIEERQNRKKLIIELIKKEKEITIKDAMSVIKGCSEKTIQRELGALVTDNVLKKEGKKRWCRYSLK